MPDASPMDEKNSKGLFTEKKGVHNLVQQGGMLEILARIAWLRNRYNLTGPVSSVSKVFTIDYSYIF